MYSVYLIRSEYKDAAQILRSRTNLKEIEVDQGLFRSQLFLRKTETQKPPPSWVTFINQITVKPIKVKTQTASAIWVIYHADRIFAIPFGYGRMLIKPEAIEKGFGLNTVLNTVESNALKSLHTKTHDGVTISHSVEASSITSVAGFGLNVDNSLLSAASGSPANQEVFGLRISGKDQLRTRLSNEIRHLPQLLATALEQSASTRHFDVHPWASRMRPITDSAKQTQLLEDLTLRFSEGDIENSWLVIPEAIEILDLVGYRFEGHSKATLYQDLTWESFLESIGSGGEISSEVLFGTIVQLVTEPEETVRRSWKLFPDCVYAEIEEDGNKYFLHEGEWYSVRSDYLDQLEDEIKELFETNRALPHCYEMGEDDYNSFLAKESDGHYFLMHRKNLGQFENTEFCDLYGKDKQLLFVKPYSGSSNLSHLFNQGVTVGKHLFRSQAYRNDVNAYLPQSHKFSDPRLPIQPSDFEFRYVIIKFERDKSDRIPIFSQITLREAATSLKGLGYRVKVEIVPGTAKH